MMPVNWGMQQFRPKTELNLAPAIQTYFQGQQNKRKQQLHELTLDDMQKQKARARKIQEIRMTTAGNPQATLQGLESIGEFGEADKFRKGVMEQQESARKAQQSQMELQKQQSERLGQLARGVTTSDNPAQAYKQFQNTVIKERLPVGRGFVEYQVSDEDVGLPPELVTSLNYMGQSSVNPGTSARVRTIYGNGKVWLQKPDGTVEPARDPATGKQLSESQSYKTVVGDDQIYKVNSKTGVMEGTGVKPKGKTKESVDIAKTVQETEIAGEKWEAQKEKNLESHQKTKLKHKSNIDKFARFSNKARKIAQSPDLKFITGGGRYHPTRGKSVPLMATPGKDLQADLDNLISMGAINTMIQLKAESKTGSTGFGALSEKELGILQNALGAFKDDEVSVQKKRELLIEVAEIVDKYQDSIEQFESEYEIQEDLTEDDIFDKEIEGL
jgi:hypothetical protein